MFGFNDLWLTFLNKLRFYVIVLNRDNKPLVMFYKWSMNKNMKIKYDRKNVKIWS